MGKGPTAEEKLSQFLGQAMYAGRQAANDIASIQQNQGTSGRPHQNEDVFYDSASEYVTRMAGSLPSDVVEMLQKQLPRGTKIILPRGQQLDTRVVTSNNDFHARNNRISGACTSSNVAPGMLSNLQPDFSQYDEQLQQAAMNLNSLANILSTMDSSFFATAKPTPDSMAQLDNRLASELAASITPTITIEDPVLVVFPFQFHVDETTLNNAARELTELGGDSLGVVGSEYNGGNSSKTIGRTNAVSIQKRDKDRLAPGIYLNDSPIDFWLDWQVLFLI